MNTTHIFLALATNPERVFLNVCLACQNFLNIPGNITLTLSRHDLKNFQSFFPVLTALNKFAELFLRFHYSLGHRKLKKPSVKHSFQIYCAYVFICKKTNENVCGLSFIRGFVKLFQNFVEFRTTSHTATQVT